MSEPVRERSTSVSGLDVDIKRDLAALGRPVHDLFDLTHDGRRYPAEVTELLVSWVDRLEHDPSLQEVVVRQLTVPWARQQALPVMLRLFRTAEGGSPPKDSRRFAIGNALEVLATERVFDEMVELATDASFGRSRQPVVHWLRRAKKNRDRAVDVCIALTGDDDVDGHAVDALARLEDPRSAVALRTKVDDSRPWVRRAARRTLERFEAHD